MRNVWTKKNVEKMYSEDLVKFYNNAMEIKQDGERLGVETPGSDKSLKFLVPELKKRGLI